MAARDTDYPAWQQPDGTLLWVAPLTATNTQLRYGKFSRLFVDTLRPARDAFDQPVLDFTADGAIRGQVMMGSGPRHVDVTAKRRRGARAELIVAARSASATVAPIELILTTARCEVIEVRAQRLADLLEVPAMLALPREVDWSKPDAKRNGGTIAGAIWDRLLEETMRPVPQRYMWARNPWVWIHRVKEIT